MPRRSILTERQRSALFDLPTDEANLLQHYILADDDIEHIRTRREARKGLVRMLKARWEICPLSDPLTDRADPARRPRSRPEPLHRLDGDHRA